MRSVPVNKVVLLGVISTAFACQVLAAPHPTDAIPDYDERREYDDSGGGGYGTSSSFFDRSSPSISIDEYPRPGVTVNDAIYCVEIGDARFVLSAPKGRKDKALEFLKSATPYWLENNARFIEERWYQNCEFNEKKKWKNLAGSILSPKLGDIELIPFIGGILFWSCLIAFIIEKLSRKKNG